jgi:glutamate-5-semialdehyde dehydrogenase
MTSEQKKNVLGCVLNELEKHRQEILSANKEDVENYTGGDIAMLDRLKVDHKKIDGMIGAVNEVLKKPDPVHIERYRFDHNNGMTVVNRTAPFGTILIIYESRPDVTIEAAVLAFKAGSKILLKGGKEAHRTNRVLVEVWKKALRENGQPENWVEYLDYPREQTQEFLRHPDRPIDLIVPRGGERLIEFVKKHARCPVLVSGRGNNFLYIHEKADWSLVEPIVINAKTQKISACNALDKILVDNNLPDLIGRLEELIKALKNSGVEIIVDEKVSTIFSDYNFETISDEKIWKEEFLDMKIVIGISENMDEAISKINEHSGGHSASIITTDEAIAREFMEQVDAAAVYHNASTRFTDGGQFGMGAELAISTDKLHHRGPLGLEQLVTNKWYVYGEGQVR